MVLKMKQAIEEIIEYKSNKTETEVVTNNQQSICKHLSHILLVFM